MNILRKLFITVISILTLSLFYPNFLPELPASSVEAAKVRISKKKVTLIKGQKLTLRIKGTKSKVKWSSSRRSVASVTQRGKITARKRGTATITAKVNKKSYKCKVIVEVPVLNKKTHQLNVGDTYKLKLSRTKQKISWKSSNPKIATVNKGNVSAIAPGSVTITATVLKKKYSCKITVASKKQPDPPTDSSDSSDLAINNSMVYLRRGQKARLTTNALPGEKITWKSLDTNVASVDSNGEVTGHIYGTTVIVAKNKNSIDFCTITVQWGSKDHKISEANVTATKSVSGDTITVTVTNKNPYTISASIDYIYYLSSTYNPETSNLDTDAIFKQYVFNVEGNQTVTRSYPLKAGEPIIEYKFYYFSNPYTPNLYAD